MAKSSRSPTERTLEYLRDHYPAVEIVERRITTCLLKDFGGFADIIAYNDIESVAVQATDGTSVSKRYAKILAEPRAKLWLAGPGRRLVIMGWRKYAKPVDGKFWRPRLVEVKLDDWATSKA